MTNYRFTSAALTELRQATLYYEEQENGQGAIFQDEIEAAIERILANPHAWHPLFTEQGGAEPIGFRSVSFTRFDPMRFLSLP